jgi:hypothetical protein
MYVGSNIYYPMYFVLECYPKPINVLTDTFMSILTLSRNKPLITLHSFLTWGNKACNLKLWSELVWLFTVTVTLMLTVTATNAIDLLLWTLMVHLRSQWWVIKLVVYLDMIVKGDRQRWSSEVFFSFGLTRQVSVSVMTRDSSRDLVLVSGKSGRVYHLYTLPLLVIHYH